VTVATGTVVTVSVADPLCPSLVAVICAEPAAIAFTSPELETVATAVLLDAHATARPVSVFPLASFIVAVACVDCPTETDDAAKATVTVATGTVVTVSVAEPLCPSLVAVIWAEPAAIALTSPELETVATAVLLDAHVTVRPVRVAPVESFSVTVACVDCPAVTDDAPNATATVATGSGGGAVTTRTTDPVWVSLVALIRDVPTPIPLMTPLSVIVATARLLDAHVTVRFARLFPLESFVTAVARVL
jgi:hypothetical protein